MALFGQRDKKKRDSSPNQDKLMQMKRKSRFQNDNAWHAIYQSVVESSKYSNSQIKLPHFAIKSNIIAFKEFYRIWMCLPNYVQIRQP
jgi:hypothetical protein